MTEKNLQYYQSVAANATIRTQAYIGGEWVDAVSGETFDTINPASGEVIAKVASCDVADVNKAVANARATFDSGVWSNMHPNKRGRILVKFADLIAKNKEELAVLEVMDMGKPISDALAIDLNGTINTMRWYGEAADKTLDEIAPTDPSALAMVTREPLGVVGAVVPWNFPLVMAAWKLGPALATGNCVVLKPAEQSPLSALRLAELAVEAGIPAGVLNVVPGLGHTAGKALGLHMDVDGLVFTGSTQVGKYFMEYSGQSNLKRVALECGGKSAHIVMADCPDLDAAAKAAAGAIFFNQGEVCTAGSRLLLDRKIKDEFLEKVLKAAKYWVPGEPLCPKTNLGAIVDDQQYKRILEYIDIAKKEGANLRTGGDAARTETGGYFVSPTIFDGVTPEMTIAREEIFGPVLSVIEFDGEEEAIKIANSTIYGLAAAVWSENISRAHRVARALQAGTIWVNCWDPTGDMTIPFGGYKQSGFGRDKSLHAMEKYTNLKTTWVQL
ncbi:aldehyde dehydrogenase [Kordiimonas sediminis]|uniref:Aldehyde dehydrogenase n=1 Tax=Kordiimonas sediminis TaxID=1735581 RepID=A0A919E9H2_9PROT|nr:aldehyde dehydrogenase [Kordiimonas sediminis]GHF26139.1 aldehyde dehydrogenase [Kordiimonas sediminis]